MHELDVLPFPASPGHGERSVRWRRAALLTALAVGVLAFLAMATSARANGVPLNNGDVLVGTGNGTVAHFDHSGNLLDTLDNGTGAFYSTGMCTDSNTNLYVTEFGQENISVFDVNGNLTHQTFGSAYNSDPESCTVDASNNIYVGEADGSGTVLKFDTSGNLLASYNPALGGRGTDWVDLAADQCTLYYTSEDSSVHRFDVCTNTQLPDFASGLPGPCYELRIRPNGEVMVACSTEAVRLDTTGNIIQTYPIPGASVLFALNLDPDGTTFWTADLGNSAGPVYHVDIATGNILTQFNSNPPQGQAAGLLIVGGIVVSQPSMTLSPSSQSQTTGSSATVTANLTIGGNPASGKTILFSVSGANTASGSATTDTAGNAPFSYTGTNAGTDTVTACYDANNNGVCDSGELTRTATVTWTGSQTDPAITANGVTLTVPGTCETVATFTDPDTSATASEYSATVTFPNGKTSTDATIIQTGPGKFRVRLCQRFAKAGSHTMSVTITDVDNSSNTATVQSTWNTTSTGSGIKTSSKARRIPARVPYAVRHVRGARHSSRARHARRARHFVRRRWL